jgi:biotin carboxyl carrier protein
MMSGSNREIWVTVSGQRFLVQVEDLNQDPVVAYVDGSRFEVSLDDAPAASQSSELQIETETQVHSVPAGTSCQVTAPMPGDIVKIHVQVGGTVQAGDPLCVLDAMKMKNTIHAPQNGTIAEICVKEGDSVEYGVSLFRLGES